MQAAEGFFLVSSADNAGDVLPYPLAKGGEVSRIRWGGHRSEKLVENVNAKITRSPGEDDLRDNARPCSRLKGREAGIA